MRELKFMGTNREIKFRGKSTNSIRGVGKWTYGHLMDIHKHNRLFIGEWRKIGGDATVKDELFSSYVDVDQKTIGQYTGINDINGVEIYEGDVVRFTQEWEIEADRDKIEVVQFQHGGFTPMCRTLGGVYYGCESERYEVIGNVHDNPELKKYI